jgi:hypothetical protein
MRGTWQGSGTWQSGGSGGGKAALVVLAVVLAAAVAKPVTAAAGSVARVVAEVLTVAVVVVASLAGLAVFVGLALVAVRIRRRILDGPRAAVPRRVSAVVLDGRQGAGLPEPGARALPAARGDVPALPREYADTHVVTRRPAPVRCPRRDRRWS